MNITSTTVLITEIGILLGAITPCIVAILCLINGMKCLLRSEILKIYYNHKDVEKIRQYEYENLEFLYKAYKALKGNSFIDKIHKEIEEWEVES